jgi:hypothetical protein
MSASTGIPYNVIAAQANAESGFSSTAQSSAGALGWLQFLPSTYNASAKAAGVSPGTEFNPADEAKVYDVYMGGLLKQEHGNIKNALAAYNAGPGNISAGMGYANQILGQSGASPNISTTGAFGIPGLPSLSISGILGNALGDMRDIFERLGLIILGAALILLGIKLLSGGSSGGSSVTNITETAAPAKGKHAKGGKTIESTGASEAAEAAAVA